MALGKVFFSALLFASLAVSACGGDDDDDNGSSGSAGSAGSSSMNVQCDESGDGTCENATDCPKVESGEARMSAQSCGISCLQDEDQAACAVGCIVEDTGITQACATCYAAAVKCAADNCLAQCGGDPAGQACADCQEEKGCRAAFDECSGLPPQG